MDRSHRLLARVALSTLLVLCAAGVDVAGEPDIRFLNPRPRAAVLGDTKVELWVDPGTDDAVERIEVSVDGRLVATLTEAPWSFEWDSGDGSKGHSLSAVLRTRSGAQALTGISTSALRVHQIEHIDLVNLYLVALDSSGDYVTGLTRDDFRVYENGDPQPLQRFSAHHKPLKLSFVLDTSHSMEGGKIERAKRAALEFLDILGPEDDASVVGFSNDVRLSQSRTSDRRLLQAAIENSKAGGGTALYDAVWRTSREMRSLDGRRVIVLLSDGQDESYSGLEPGSLHTLDEALDQALRSEVMLFTIGLGRDLEREYVRRWTPGGLSNVDTEQSVADVLRLLADSTGGRAVISAGAGKLKKAFGEIAADLRNQYSLAYVSTDERRDGTWRAIRVESTRPDLRIVTRRGYYAPRDGSDGD